MGGDKFYSFVIKLIYISPDHKILNMWRYFVENYRNSSGNIYIFYLLTFYTIKKVIYNVKYINN